MDEVTNVGGADAGSGEGSGVAAESGGSLISRTGAVGGSGGESGDAGAVGGASLISRMAGEGGEDGPDAGGKAGEQDAGGEKTDPALAVTPDGPEGYDLSFGEGTEVDQHLLGDFTRTAHELGLTKGQAQKLAAMYEARINQATQAVQDEQAAALRVAREAWISEIKGRPTFKSEESQVKKALAAFGSPELFDLLDQTRLGDHPVFWNFMARTGQALGEPGFHGRGAGGGPEPPLPARMWPNM